MHDLVQFVGTALIDLKLPSFVAAQHLAQRQLHDSYRLGFYLNCVGLLVILVPGVVRARQAGNIFSDMTRNKWRALNCSPSTKTLRRNDYL